MNSKWLKVAQELHDLQIIIKDHVRREELLKKELKELSNYQTHMEGCYIYFKEYRKGGVDYDAIPALIGIDLESFRKNDIEIWRLKRTS